ncbi:hypothetical protein PR048_019052 [Dryococelus australis]|uniref:Uncharacterized protein n=1 Tax=Dryococelus australis TaxID=614101 RepID=A0ABQ9H2E2_9NEOP|nr:hypothetical protein PR048_019052 [Dryococelus australis]
MPGCAMQNFTNYCKKTGRLVTYRKFPNDRVEENTSMRKLQGFVLSIFLPGIMSEIYKRRTAEKHNSKVKISYRRNGHSETEENRSIFWF